MPMPINLLCILALFCGAISSALADTVAYINEIHYDNTGTDTGEFIEVAHIGSITGYTIIRYNGNGGAVYSTPALTGTATFGPDVNGFQYTVFDYAQDGIQNGSPDGIALVAPNGSVIEFLSYEGTLTAVGGAANGLTSTDIGVSEPGMTAIGMSLQRVNFTKTWAGPLQNTKGAGNIVVTTPNLSPVAAPFAVPSNVSFIHDIQGNGSPITTSFPVNVTAIVTSTFTKADVLNGFWMQEEDSDADLDPNTSEGIFVLCGLKCPNVLVGDLVNVVGIAGQSFTTTQIDSSLANGSVVVRSSGNPLPTAVLLALPAPFSTSDVSTFQSLEGMRVTFETTLAVSEYFQLARFGEIVLTESSVPYTFTQNNNPSVSGLANAIAELAKRRITLDDDNDDSNDAISGGPDEPYFYPSGGLSLTNKFRGGDTIKNLTGVLQYAFSKWRLRPISGTAYNFLKSNTEPANPGNVGGTLRITSFNVLNYFTTLDTTSTGCGPTGSVECRGANTASELSRQTAKIVAALDKLNPDIAGLVELQNSASNSAISALVAALNAKKGSGMYSFIPTGIIGTDAIAVGLIYKSSVVQPVNKFTLLTSAVNPLFIDTRNRPVLIQTFQQLSTGARLTVSVCHMKSKGSACSGDPNKNDGQGNCANTRRDAVTALVNYLSTDPTSSGDPDHLILGDLNAYAREDAIMVLKNAGYTDLAEAKAGNQSYSYLFDGQRGTLDYGMASPSLLPQVVNASVWNINSDEVPIFDYNDEFFDTGEASFDRESSFLQIYTPDQFRSSDHDPLLIGLTLQGSVPVAAPLPVPVKAPAPIPVSLPAPVPAKVPAPIAVPIVSAPLTVPIVSAPLTVPVPIPVQAVAPAPVALPVPAPIPINAQVPVTIPSPGIIPVPVGVPDPIKAPESLPVPIHPPSIPVTTPIKAPAPLPVPIPGAIPPLVPVPVTVPTPTSVSKRTDCGPLGLNIFCPFTLCGIFGRFFGFCD